MVIVGKGWAFAHLAAAILPLSTHHAHGICTARACMSCVFSRLKLYKFQKFQKFTL